MARKLALVVLLAAVTWLAASADARAWWRGRYAYNGFSGFRGYGGAYRNPYTGGFYRVGAYYNPYTGRDVHMQRSYNSPLKNPSL